MSDLERQSSTFVLNGLKQARRCALWRERCNNAVESPWRRKVNYPSVSWSIVGVATTNKKRFGVADIVPCDYCGAHWVLKTCLLSSYCAGPVLPLRFMGLFYHVWAYSIRPPCATTEIMTLAKRALHCSNVCNTFTVRFYYDIPNSNAPKPPPTQYGINTVSQSIHNQCRPTPVLHHGRIPIEIDLVVLKRSGSALARQKAHWERIADQIGNAYGRREWA